MGHLTEQSPFEQLADDLRALIPAERIIQDPLRRMTYATDASFYQMVPGLVVIVWSDQEVQGLLKAAHAWHLPVTFRASGTSLSGQAVTDGVLAMLGDGWQQCQIHESGQQINLGPGVIGAEANRALAGYQRKIGPDPASINAARIGGIAANNASGMCCGTADNSYKTLQGMRLILADGTLLDTRDAQSREAFIQAHPIFVARLKMLAQQTRENSALRRLIARKFQIKNTTGYSLNALIDYEDPIDILSHLMIGSEGTLGFISEITFRTVEDPPHQASALLFFATVKEACEAVVALQQSPVSAVELIDRRGLKSVELRPELPDYIRHLGEEATALLVETRAAGSEQLAQQIEQITQSIRTHTTLHPVAFSSDPKVCQQLWSVRKGLFPSLGTLRAPGTTVIIEDVAFPLERLAVATQGLQQLFTKHGYDDAIIFGHALEGNLHFVFAQDFATPSEVERYSQFMDDVATLVVDKHGGSLKAEHGTGRNMAPFVEQEWGAEAYRLMQQIKQLFDPYGLLNPGVILSDDPELHLKNLKPTPAMDAMIDTCIECGFCEPTCPSTHLTLTPRQRIAGWRQIGNAEGKQAELLRRAFDHDGLDTCAACGLCATVCPMGIETGQLTRKLRGEGASSRQQGIANWSAEHYAGVLQTARLGLGAAAATQRLVGPRIMDKLGSHAHSLSGGRLPQWSHTLPTPVKQPVVAAEERDSQRPKVVYYPSCVSRTMGPQLDDVGSEALPVVVERLLKKAGYAMVLPDHLNGLCCGKPFESKGLERTANGQAERLSEALYQASEQGKWPILIDTSPCTLRMQQHLKGSLPVVDLAEFLHLTLLPKLQLGQKIPSVALHHTCSSRRMGLMEHLEGVARACAEEVVIPQKVGCCGFAGDRGFTEPELNAHALRHLAEQLPDHCHEGVSTSRTCEIGLSLHGERPYRSIAHLLDRMAKEPV
uniref:D-lactate dehydrogenase (cytochrome) n=1 Tax=Magnetococcus massalia (strain MO-1) TaxID=451514 RepID=A0A1S7LC94_MAGMO|nr:putative protein with electron carrier activity. putative iron-sulfur cluster binding. putative FAD/FMN-containing dehydrogenase [Candidatus Magnetococcus massalia]